MATVVDWNGRFGDDSVCLKSSARLAQIDTFTGGLTGRELDHNGKSGKLMLIVDYTKEWSHHFQQREGLLLVTVWFGFES